MVMMCSSLSELRKSTSAAQVVDLPAAARPRNEDQPLVGVGEFFEDGGRPNSSMEPPWR